MKSKHWVVHLSPGGSTRHVGGIIGKTLENMGSEVQEIDLTLPKGASEDASLGADLTAGDCLWVGSPVYGHHVLPQVMDFLPSLSPTSNTYAVPFVTYGGVTSGMGLYEMGELLSKSGFQILGAAKIIAVHSMMWPFEDPLGKGHPNSEDDDLIRGLVKSVHGKLAQSSLRLLDVKALDYQPLKSKETFNPHDISQAGKRFPPMEIDQDLCNKCGLCADQCPTQNISLDSDLHLGKECVYCLNCVRLCESAAITNPIMDIIERRLRHLAAGFAEPAQTRIFL